MTAPEIIDADVVEVMDDVSARRLDTKIRLTVETVKSNLDKLQEYVHRAQVSGVHIALGFPSWTAYLADVFDGQPLLLEREDRRELVEFLASEGMSTRAIAPIVGVSRETVRREVSGDTDVSPRSDVAGLDGKTYPASPPAEPKSPRRKSLPEAYWNAVWDLQKSIERLERFTNDDRFARNRRDLADRNQKLVDELTDRLQDLGSTLAGREVPS